MSGPPGLTTDLARLLQILSETNTPASNTPFVPSTPQQWSPAHFGAAYPPPALPPAPPALSQQQLQPQQPPYAQFQGLYSNLQQPKPIQPTVDPRLTLRGAPAVQASQPAVYTQAQQPAERQQQYPLHPQQLRGPSPEIDPTTITQWPAALRYVMGTIARNEAIMSRIQRMKKNQKDNERNWHLGREAIIQKQLSRKSSSAEVEALLRSFSSNRATSSAEIVSAETERQELLTFDTKVHKAATQMVEAMESELRSIGIPFFCYAKGKVTVSTGLSQKDLREMKRKMAELLGDLVSEE